MSFSSETANGFAFYLLSDLKVKAYLQEFFLSEH